MTRCWSTCHAYGLLAAYTPVMHLRRVDGAFFNTYLESFERVWASARVAGRLAGGVPIVSIAKHAAAGWTTGDDPHAPRADEPQAVGQRGSFAISRGEPAAAAARPIPGWWTIPTGGLKKKRDAHCSAPSGSAGRRPAWRLRLTGLVGVFSDPRHTRSPTADGEVRQSRSTPAFTASRSAAGWPRTLNPMRPPGSRRRISMITTCTPPSAAVLATPSTALSLMST